MNNTDSQLEPTERQRLEMAGDQRAMRPACSYGVYLIIDNAMKAWPGPHTADVVVSYNGKARQFTYAEFLTVCGFENKP